MDLKDVMEIVAKGFEAVGVAIMVIGGAHALIRLPWRGLDLDTIYDDARRRFGRPLILGLEVLVAADIIQSVTVDSSVESIAMLGLLVLVRVVLSISLDIEVDGRLPWRRASANS